VKRLNPHLRRSTLSMDFCDAIQCVGLPIPNRASPLVLAHFEQGYGPVSSPLFSLLQLEHRTLPEPATLLSGAVEHASGIDQQTRMGTSSILPPSEAMQHRFLAGRDYYAEHRPAIPRTAGQSCAVKSTIVQKQICRRNSAVMAPGEAVQHILTSATQ